MVSDQFIRFQILDLLLRKYVFRRFSVQQRRAEGPQYKRDSCRCKQEKMDHKRIIDMIDPGLLHLFTRTCQIVFLKIPLYLMQAV